jgi:hypothetical protein
MLAKRPVSIPWLAEIRSPVTADLDDFAGLEVQAPLRRWPLNLENADTGQADFVAVPDMASCQGHQIV